MPSVFASCMRPDASVVYTHKRGASPSHKPYGRTPHRGGKPFGRDMTQVEKAMAKLGNVLARAPFEAGSGERYIEVCAHCGCGRTAEDVEEAQCSGCEKFALMHSYGD